MRHQKAGRKLGRDSSHRKALLRTLATQFFESERIVTTVPKAKELRPYAEKIITLAKRETLHARRQALGVLRKKAVVQKLFDDLAPRFADRNGGYCRIIRLGLRKGDAAEQAIIELLGSEYQPAKAGKSDKRQAKPKAATKAKPAAKPERKSGKAEEKAGESKPKGRAPRPKKTAKES
jgi:large subunit ribosomal protein L17